MRIHKVFTLLATLGMVSKFVSGKRIPSYAGPYVITCRTFTNVSDEYKSTGKIWGKLFFTPPRPKQLQYVWGKWYSAVPLSDELKMGLQEVRNQTVSPVFPFFPVLPYARYLFTTAIIDTKGDTVGLYAVDGDAIPKL